MKEKAREPAIRFSEFAGAWEQRKVKDLAANTYGGGTPSTSNPEFWEGSIPWIQSSDLSEHNLFRVHPRKFISQAAVANSPVKIIPENSIAVITRVGVGKLAVMSFSYTTSQDFLSLGNLNTDVKFASYQLYRRLQKDLNAVQGTSIKGITKEELLGKNIDIPGRQEQEAIGKFFSKIDSLLTLHQRKYEQFLILKESMIQKLFPKDGEHAPEIRFSGCAGDWEQRLLGDIYLERNERGSKSLDILSVSIHSGISEKNLDAGALGKIVRRSEDKSLYKHVFPGDLVFNMMRAWQGALGVVKKEGMVSPAYISAIPNAEVYPGFMNYCLRRKNVINQINNLSYGVTDFRKRLYWDSFVKIKISLPSISEQKKITEFLTRLDAAINLHKRRLGMLKNVKQAFLEKMFI